MNGEMARPAKPQATAAAGAVINVALPGDGATYEIWRRHGDSGEWGVHATTADASFHDAPVKPGQYYEYRIRTIDGDSHSEFSESAVAYGLE